MIKELSKIKQLPIDAHSHRSIIDAALELGCIEAQVMMTRSIVLGNWIKLQCQFGCAQYGHVLTCPPYTPSPDEMSGILMDYQKCLLIQAAPGRNVLDIVLHLESLSKEKGYRKAFAICSGPCEICEVCTLDTGCKYPEQARPSLQACGIDMAQTLDNFGWNNSNSHKPCSKEYPFGMVLLH